MKNLLIYLRTFILCFSLMHLSMTPGYVLAQESETSGVVTLPEGVDEAEAPSQEDQQAQADEASEQQYGEETQSSNNNNNDQQLSRVDTRQGEDGSAGMMSGLMDLVTMMGVGLLAKTMIMYEPITTDMMIAMAAGLAYIYGEVSTMDATRDKMKSETFVLTHYEDGSTNNKQREALERQKKSYEDLGEMMDTKATMKKTAAAGFAAAAAMAAISGATISGASVSCITSTSTYAATCAPPYNTTPCPCVAGAAAIAGTEATATAAEMTPGATSAAQEATVEAASNSTSTTASSSCAAAAAPCTSLDNLRRMLNTSSTMGMTKSALISGGAGLLMDQLGIGPLKGLVTATFFSMSTFHDTMMATPYMRAVSFGILAGLSYAGASQSEKQAEAMRENAQTIQSMLDKIYELQDVNVADLEAESQPVELNDFLEPSEDFDDRLAQEDSPCGPEKKKENPKGCESFKKEIEDGIKRDQANGIGNLPAAVSDAAGQIGNVADSLRETGGLSDSALSDTASLSENASALMDLNKRVQDKINRQLKRNGGKTVDFEGHGKKFEDQLKKAVIDTLKSRPDQTSKALAMLNGNSKLDEPNKEDSDAGEGSSVNNKSVASKSNQESEAFKVPEMEEANFDMDLEMDEENAMGANALKDQEGKTHVNVDKSLDTDGEDIIKNKEVSIFKVISVRYLKSGIPKLMDLE